MEFLKRVLTNFREAGITISRFKDPNGHQDYEVKALDVNIVDGVTISGDTAITIADGDDAALGAVADAPWSGTGSGTLIAVLKALYGRVGLRTLISVDATLDISAYASGEVLADTQVITNFFDWNDQVKTLDSVTILDKADLGVAMTLLILDANVSFGIENAAPSITDTNAQAILGVIDIPSSMWYDVGGAKIQKVNFEPFKVRPAAGTRNLYFALWNGTGTPTFAADSLRLIFGGE